ncbi:serine/threonine protein kinase [Micromonospora echinospora]|uniref:Serine/threonine protein kinase n=1 Tax=Micromonospora echinospora TaxID=1877 RepID=A0A1C4V5U3_MICEC|nr:BREX system serine/threonine kinase PglW [Micromonospora echinospora]OZV83114.1 serine/threonine protein kinase [Micromonospora echinospora]SCE79418.1 serine/threonine protein kinase [Micromonospora echinospora]
MREDSPRWKQINPSSHVHEQDGLRELASYLPDIDPYHVWANVEFVGTDGSINEVDALVLTPSGLYVLELKHWQGTIRGDGTQWVRRFSSSRLIPEDNPAILVNRKARRLASVMRYYARQQGRQDQVPYVGAAVFLHARDMRAELDPIGRQHVYGLDGHPSSGLPSLKQELLLAQPRDPVDRIDPDRGRQIVDLVRAAKIRSSVADRKVGQLLLHPRPFAEGLGWQDFLAGHTLDTGLVRRVRFYLASRAAEHEVPAIRRAAEREFRLLQGIHHPGIARAYDLVDHPWGPAVVFDHDPGWVRLDQWLRRRGDTLTLAQRLRLVQDLCEIIEYAHARRLAHRALSPRAVHVDDPDGPRPKLVVTDWQAGGRLAHATRLTRLGPSSDPANLELFFDDEVRRYQAPEASTAAPSPGHQLDVFALGALAYRIFAGVAPANTPEELATAVRDSGLHLDAAVDGMPDALVTTVYDATRGDPAQRLAGVSAIRARLEKVWEDLTAPEPEPVIDPLHAHRGDVLDGGLTVKARLGSGATAVALLVTPPSGGEPLVLKVARDEQHSERLVAEGRTLAKLKHPQVAALVGEPLQVGGRTALLMESAGARTLAEDLRGGRLALDLLERYGRDLLDIVAYLDGQGIWHRDLKPANLAARPRPKDKQPHLCVFDFSLSSAPADQLVAGTVGYLDPFLGPPARLRYDAAAERFAAAVTLYEMATGTLPKWGENANPAAVSDEVTLDPAAFDSAVADRLVEFFARALARDAARRFDTVDEMTDAWRAIFQQVPQSAPTPGRPAVGLNRSSPLAAAELTARARSALERLNVHTVGELLDAEPSALTRAKGVPDATRKEILAQARVLRALLPGGEQPDSDTGDSGDRPLAHGVEALADTLLPPPSSRNRRLVAVLLGQAPTEDGAFLRWPSQSEVARATGRTQPQVSVLLAKQARTSWSTNPALRAVREEIVTLLDSRGGVMSAEELAEAVIAARGSHTEGPRRLPQAIGLVRAAVEAELTTGGDARVAIQRLRSSSTVLVGREPDDPSSDVTAADLLGYVVRLGRRTRELVAADPLPTRQRAVEELRRLPAPSGMALPGELRLLQLAAAGSNGEADVNAQGQLYPVGMAAERALRLSAGILLGQRLTPDQIRDRVRTRFPRAEELPGRPTLTDLLAAADIPLTWYPADRHYGPPAAPAAPTSTRLVTTHAPLLTLDAADEVGAKLTSAVERRAFLAVLAPRRRLAQARRALLDRLPLTEVDVTATLLTELRALGFPWEAIVAADNGSPTDADFRSLTELVQHHVVPAVSAAVAAADGPVLLTEAAPLVRYGQLRLLQELADPTRSRPAARLLLVAARRAEPAMLDGVQLPLTAPASQSVWLADPWLDRVTA